MNNYSIGADGTHICHYYEQLRLRAYPDPGSELARAMARGIPRQAGMSGAPWTIGWGDTGPDVVEGLVIDEAEANRRFDARMAREFEPAVLRTVHIPIDQKQFDALVSIFYNAGVPNMTSSTLVRLLNLGDTVGAANQFPRWNKSGGIVMKGLQRRRHAEMLVFEGEGAIDAIAKALALYP